MPLYEFRAVRASGERVRGRDAAPSAASVERALQSRGLLVLRVRESRRAGGFAPRRRAAVLEWTRAVSALLQGGLPLVRALAAAGRDAGGELGPALADVVAGLQRGETLAAALARYPALFPPLYVGVVRAGERTGDLAGAFARLCVHLEAEAALRSRLLSALLYPAVLLVVALGAVLVLLLFVLPRFADILAGTGLPLPATTALLLGASAAAGHHALALSALAVAIPAGAVALRRSPGGRVFVSQALLAVPLTAALRRQALGARFAALAAVLLSGGTPLLAALQICAEAIGDPVAAAQIEGARLRVRSGASLHSALTETGVFPPLLHQLVGVGEEGGQLAGFLSRAGELLAHELDRSLSRLVTLLEPGIIVVFGALVALIALSLLQAVYGINAGALR